MNDVPEMVADARLPVGRYGQPEMVERVARAIRKAAYGSERGWHYEVEEARAAIAAMREPSPQMIEAGASAIDDATQWTRDGGEDEMTIFTAGRDYALPGWRAMIDTALTPTPQPGS